MSDEAVIASWKARPDWSRPSADHPAGGIWLTSGDQPGHAQALDSFWVICITLQSTCG